MKAVKVLMERIYLAYTYIDSPREVDTELKSNNYLSAHEVEVEDLTNMGYRDDIKLPINFKDYVMNVADNVEQANSEPKTFKE